MNNFFKTFYDHARNTKALDLGGDAEYRMASDALDRLLEIHLAPDTDAIEEITNAANGLVYRTNIIALAYGFRLGVRVTAPDCL